MEVLQEQFGDLDGQVVNAFTLKNSHGMEITCLNYGCIITKIMMPDADGKAENIVLGFNNLDDYLKLSPYFGAVVGRVAGRIAKGEFILNGKSYHVTQNEKGNHLHGGNKGFSRVLWNTNIVEKGHFARVEFYHKSFDGEEGYPGNLDMKVVYTLNEENELRITYEGKTDADTLLNVTNHTYFNLSGNLKRDILKHTLTMKSNRFLELNEALLPTGEILDVTDTPFDFREGRTIEDGLESVHEQNHIVGNGFDHPFLLNVNHEQEIILKDDESGRELVIETVEPSVVLYTGNKLRSDFSIYGVSSRKYLGLCLETQGLPDSIHHPHFKPCILKPGDTYQTETKYTFRTVKRGE